MNPRQVTLDVSSACNLRCRYCAVSGSCRDDSEPMDVPAALTRLRQQGYGVVVLTGGEPTLHRELASWLAHARAIGFEQRTIVTNATRLGDPETVRRLVDAGLTHVNVSFHTCRPALFDELAGVPGAFEQARAGLATLLEVNEALGRPLYVHTNLLLMQQTAGHVAETIGFLGALGVRWVTLEVVRARGAVLGREEEFRCRVPELGHALGAAREAAARAEVTLNTVDLPPCLLGAPAGFDIASYVVRREKEIHWVVSGRSEGSLNRDTHLKAPSCAACAFDRWCTGVERTLLGASAAEPAPRDAELPFPEPVAVTTLLEQTRRALEQASEAVRESRSGAVTGAPPMVAGDATATRSAGAEPATRRSAALRALEVCSLFTPPDASSLASWLRLYEAYARTLLPFAADDPERAAEAIGLFLPPGPRVTAERASALVRLLERRERVLAERIASLASALTKLPCSPPACCANAARGAELPLAWLQSIVRAASSPWLCSALVPALVPYVWCAPDCSASLELARARLELLDADERRAARQLLSAPTLALGPWVRLVLDGALRADGSVGYEGRALVLLTDPSLAQNEREALRHAVARIVLPTLLGGDGLVEQAAAIVVRMAGRTVAELPRRLRWAGCLCRHGPMDGGDPAG